MSSLLLQVIVTCILLKDDTLQHLFTVFGENVTIHFAAYFSVEEFLVHEGPLLLEMRVKQLMKAKQLEKAAVLAKTCCECATFQGKGSFKQMYLVCLCATSEQDRLMDEVILAT